MATSAYAVQTLGASNNWNPSALLSPPVSEVWPNRIDLVPLQDLATYVGGGRHTVENPPVVTPNSIDSHNGRVRSTGRDYRGAIRRIGSQESDLQIGDVLVPRVGSAPALLIADHHAGLAFSNLFHVLRGRNRLLGLWIWACLSSQSGMQARRVVGMSSIGQALSPGALLSMLMPIPNFGSDLSRIEALAAETSVVIARNVNRAWWKIVNLPTDGRWHPRVFMRDEQLLEGRRLDSFATVTAGRHPKQVVDGPRPGLLPVRENRSIDGSNTRHWAPEGTAPAIAVNDVLVSTVGPRHKVDIADAPALAGQNVLIVRISGVIDPRSLAGFFSSEEGQSLFRAFAAGTVVPQLSVSSLRQLPVDTEAISSPGRSSATQPTRSLAERLEEVLWH